MDDKDPQISDKQIDTIISIMLRVGVIVSSLTVVAGAVLYLLRHGGDLPGYHIFVGEPSELRSVWGILRLTVSSSGRGIIQLGLLVLIATPVMRVAFTVISFIIQKDKVYVGVTLIVLSVLIFSLAGGGR
ncbi:MAG: DUF1634 domain-containing protein [Syntrophobacteraceae bacterium]|nr:DUF1634 domain-containing protein [Syntrophobacteraceae bacterium]